jgi:hypothetical protein
MPNFGGLTIGMNLLKIDFYLEFIGWIHVESGFMVASQGTWLKGPTAVIQITNQPISPPLWAP